MRSGGQIPEKSEICLSCRAAGKYLKTQIPQTKGYGLERLTEPSQEIQFHFSGPIKSETCGDVFILVAINRFSKWPTAYTCSNTDTRTVFKCFTRHCSDNKTPRTNCTKNGSCSKSKEGVQSIL